MVAPVLAIAVPQVTPTALRPQVTEAADAPTQVTFTLEGCNLNTGTFIEATLTCTDPGYTTGNLGKLWAELDRVPHRLTAENKGGTQTYEIKISADHLNDGTIGYDIISVPTLKSGPCTFLVGAQMIDAGQAGGADTTISRTLTITQPADTTCVFDYNMRLALGSSGYSGSSLHAYLLAEGVGEKRVPLPVDKDFPAQELRKTMTALQGQAFTWNVTKSSEPALLDFPNTCATTNDARSANVDVTVTWTRSGPTASGSTLITTEVFANNPSERTINVAVSDVIYEGTDQSTPIDTASAASSAVPANTELLLLSHSFEYTGTATQFNDVATATYTDPVNPDVQIPGNTTATADATASPAGGTADNATAIITDTESISGAGLSFAVADPSSGSFTNGYVAGTTVTGAATVDWSSGVVSASGSITFEKTVTVDEPRITSGTLTDTATVTTADGQQTLDTSDPLNIDITTDALVELDINKTIPAGSLRTGESVSFDFEISGPDNFSDTASITFDFGDPLTASTTLTGLAPGQYTVHEVPQANWADHSDQETDIDLPECDGSVSFDNSTLAPDLDILKTANDETVTAGDPIGFEIALSNSGNTGTGIAKDVTLTDALPFGDGIDWNLDSVNGTGGFTPAADACAIDGAPPAETLTCDFGDLEATEGVIIAISSDTTGDSCGVYENTAEAEASNHEKIPSTDSTEVLCPNLDIDKTTDTPVINAGEEASYTITISNEAGDAPATGVDLVDQLPSGLTWTDDSEDCDVSAGGELTCLGLEIPAGGTFSVTVTGTTDAGECPSILNRATFTSDNAGSGASHPEGQGSTITVNCPDLEVVKEQVDANGDPTDEPVDAGLTAFFAIHVTNHGPGTASEVDVLDFAPGETVWTVVDDGGFDCPATIDDAGDSCTAESMEPGTATIILSYETAEADCGVLENNVEVSASNEPPANVGLDNEAQATIVVECPGLNLTKSADGSPIVAGEEASFTIHLWNTGPGDALDVTLHDDLPPGLTWDFEVLQNPASDEDCTVASSMVLGGESQMSIGCEFGTLGVTDMAGGIVIRVFATTDRTACGELQNNVNASGSNLGEPLTASASILVRCPELVIDKLADTEVITISGPNDDLVATPSVVTWTLTYTLTDGPVTNAVITDEVPEGFVFLDATGDGELIDGVVTWSFPTLNASGSVSFRTTVDPETISRIAPTVNVAIIDSDETAPDEGEDSVTVTVIPPPLGGNPSPTPGASVPDTAVGFGPNGDPVTVPIELLVAFFIGSLGALALANVKARSRRR